ncbi:hypothetical protein D1007_04194 [Hordeum vulgare]|nr:hypothetical protein D1007_04194 [Hordeum vulgare]
MEDAVEDEPTPPLLVHCTMTIGEVGAHYMRSIGRRRTSSTILGRSWDAHVAEQAVLLKSYRSILVIRFDRRRYHQRQAELEAASKEFDEVADKVWCKSEDKEDIAGFAKVAPYRHNNEGGTTGGAAGKEQE